MKAGSRASISGIWTFLHHGLGFPRKNPEPWQTNHRAGFALRNSATPNLSTAWTLGCFQNDILELKLNLVYTKEEKNAAIIACLYGWIT